jgi:DNA polymerase III delta subunit
MLGRAHSFLEDHEVSEVTRVDVPGRGSGDEVSDVGLRVPVQAAIPALQSGSLFGERTGLLVVDAHMLQKAEAEVIAEVIGVGAAGSTVAVFVAGGTIPAPLGRVLRDLGDVENVKKLNERAAGEWLHREAKERGLRVGADAVEALLHRFGTDVASLGQALDQLDASGESITADQVRTRFKNRPDEPTWHYMDAVAGGDHGEALRRLEDFLHHGHPLLLLGTIQNDLRRRSLAAAAPDYDTFVEWDGGRRNYGMEKVWRQRSRVKAADLRLALDAVARADLQLKTTPEATHRVMMERLTIALCRWYGARR